MQNVHLLQVHIQRNRAWLQKHTEGEELRSQVSQKPSDEGINYLHLRGKGGKGRPKLCRLPGGNPKLKLYFYI